MSWDHNITINVYYDDGKPAQNKEVYVVDNGFGGDTDTDYTDSDGLAAVNVPTVMSGGSISITIYCDGEEFGPYSADDGDDFTITLS